MCGKCLSDNLQLRCAYQFIIFSIYSNANFVHYDSDGVGRLKYSTARKYWCIFRDTAAVESQFVSPV